MAWSNLATKTDAVDTFAAADVNTLMENIRVVAGNGNSAPTDDCTSLDTRVSALEAGGGDAYAIMTYMSGGFHGDFIWKDTDQIVIKAKPADGLSPFVGTFLNDGTFIRLSINTDFVLKYDTPANSGHIIDGITAKLNNEWFMIWAFEDSTSSLSFGTTWMANTPSIGAANPTTTITTVQVNGQDIGFLFPVDSHVCVWQDTDEWETPLAWQNAGAVTYDATKDKPKISSRTATNIVLGAALENNDFTVSAKVYVVDGFKPLGVSDGNIASVIGARGYKDTGFRFRTDGAGNIYEFKLSQDGTIFLFSNGSGAADYAQNQGNETTNITTTWTNYLLSFVPPDKSFIGTIYADTNRLYTKTYYNTYGEAIEGGTVTDSNNYQLKVLHKILSAKTNSSNDVWVSNRGYIL